MRRETNPNKMRRNSINVVTILEQSVESPVHFVETSQRRPPKETSIVNNIALCDSLSVRLLSSQYILSL